MAVDIDPDLFPQGLAVIRVEGEIDHDVFEAIDLSLDGGTGHRISRVVLDMAGIYYISSTGLATLVRITNHIEERDGALVLFNANERIMAAFDTMGLTSLFKFAEGRDEAIALAKTTV